jgi:hypothetical protein
MNTLRNAKALALQDVALTSGLLPALQGRIIPLHPSSALLRIVKKIYSAELRVPIVPVASAKALKSNS